MLNPTMRSSLVELLLHSDAGYRAQGASLAQSLGPEALTVLFESPWLDELRPRVSFIDGYILWPEILTAWIGRPHELSPWCDGLTALNLAGQMRLSSTNLLAPLAGLERLDLRSCARLIHLDGLEQLKQLTWLRLASCRRLTDLSPLRHCRQLRYLDLSACSQLKSLEPLRDHPNLEVLNLNRLRIEHHEAPSPDHATHGPLDVLFSLTELKRVYVGRVWGLQQRTMEILSGKVEVISE